MHESSFLSARAGMQSLAHTSPSARLLREGRGTQPSLKGFSAIGDRGEKCLPGREASKSIPLFSHFHHVVSSSAFLNIVVLFSYMHALYYPSVPLGCDSIYI